jgi:hypothetical protein
MKKWISAFALCLSVAACGGGGGGGGGGVPIGGLGFGPAPAGNGDASRPSGLALEPNFTTVGLSVASVTPAKIEATLYQGQSLFNYRLVGTAVGDFSVVNGKTLYVLIEDPDGLFEPNPVAFPYAGASPGVIVDLRGRKLEKAGTFAGNLRIYACLDSRCATRLGNVPYNLPYNVTVKANAQAAADKVTLSASFGQRPASQEIRIKAPEGWTVADLKVDSDGSRVAGTLVNPQPDQTATLRVSATDLALPGTYKAKLTIGMNRSVSPAPAPMPITVDVDYVVSPDPAVPYAFNTSALTLPLKANVPYISDQGLTAYVTQGTLSFEGVEFLTTPEQDAATYVSLRRAWLGVDAFAYPDGTFSQTARFYGCYGTGEIKNGEDVYACMPPDSYAFRLRYTHVLNGASTTIYLPGQLVISP